MELSKRLQAVANLVTPGYRVADIGTDHGYVPIYLVQEKRNQSAIAMDINQGPLARAQEHIAGEGLNQYIETRLSDGLAALNKGEAQSIVIAGMGGGLMVKILESGKDVVLQAKECILQPQSELAMVREYLWKQGYTVIAEDMVLEDGKFYPMMKMIKGADEPYSLMERRYGRLLLKQQHPVLRLFLEKEIVIKEQIIAEVEQAMKTASQEQAKRLVERIELLKKESVCAKEAYALMEGSDGDAV